MVWITWIKQQTFNLFIIGKLAPGEHVNVSLRFTPLEPRKYSFQIPVKINKNSSNHMLTIRGSGADLHVAFSPDVISLGPILPHQADPAEGVVEINNPTDYHVELYSLDFDTKVTKLLAQY